MSAGHDGERAADGGGREPLSRLEEALRGGVDASLPPDDAEIAAYVDGTLDDVSREIFETRLADDPALQMEVRDLQEIRAALAAPRGTRSSRASRPMAWLAAAAVLLLVAAGATFLVIGSRSDQIRLTDTDGPIVVHRDGTVEGTGPLSADLERLVGGSLRSGRFPLPSRLDRLRVEERTLMGPSDTRAFQVTSPVGTLVRTDRPTFRWLPLARASSYRVSVYDEALGLVIASAALTETEWTPPTPLPRGAVLLWQVDATTPDGRVLAPSTSDPQARFEIVSAAEQQAIQNRLNAAGRAHVARAAVFAEAGLIDEARAEIDALKPGNPDARVLDALLASLTRVPATP